MEALKDVLLSRDVLGWALVLVLIVLVFKLLLSAGKSLLILGCILVLVFILIQFFPGVVEPVVRLIRGS